MNLKIWFIFMLILPSLFNACIQSAEPEQNILEGQYISTEVIKNDFDDSEYWTPDWLESSPGFYMGDIKAPRFSSSGKWAFIWNPTPTEDSLILFNVESQKVYVPFTNPNPDVVSYHSFQWIGADKIFFLSTQIVFQKFAYHILNVSSIVGGQVSSYEEDVLDIELPDELGHLYGLKPVSPSGKWLAYRAGKVVMGVSDTLYLINLTTSEKFVAHINNSDENPRWNMSFSSTWIGEHQIFLTAEEDGRVRAAKLDVSNITQNSRTSQGVVSEIWVPDYAGGGFGHLVIISPSGKWLRYFTDYSDRNLELLKVGTQEVFYVNSLNSSTQYIGWQNPWIDDARIPYVISNIDGDPNIFKNEFRLLNLSYITAFN